MAGISITGDVKTSTASSSGVATSSITTTVSGSLGVSSALETSASVDSNISYLTSLESNLQAGAKGDTGATGPQGIQGVAGTNGTVWTPAIPNEAGNGVRTVFTTPSAYLTGSLMVWLNGLRESNFSETTSTTFTFTSAPYAGDELLLFYRTS